MRLLSFVLIAFCWLGFQAPVLAQHSPSQSSVAQGGQFKQLGPWEVHYIAFASTFLQPDIARIYKLTRSKAQGVISISVLDKDSKASQRVSVTGYALNALGQQVKLNFRRVSEQDSIYYLAQISHDNADEFRFFIEVQHGNTQEKLQFKHTFYRG